MPTLCSGNAQPIFAPGHPDDDACWSAERHFGATRAGVLSVFGEP